MPRSLYPRHDYTIACICPMGVELAPVIAMLDEEHRRLSIPNSDNCYILGRIANHKVVLTTMPETGNNRAAIVAKQLTLDFPSVRFGLLVGIGGGVPDQSKRGSVRLGDVVVSKPTARTGGIVQYDLGKICTNGSFERTGFLNKPPPILLSSMETTKARIELDNHIPEYMATLVGRYSNYSYPGLEHDQLFDAQYLHSGGETCQHCDTKYLISRHDERRANQPTIHYGVIGSANIVVKDATVREALRKDLDILCVEMEAAGLIESFPCLVIRGICDYADDHKNKRWQAYAAATAAAYMKELLVNTPTQDVEEGRTLGELVKASDLAGVIQDTLPTLKQMSSNFEIEQRSKLIAWLTSTNFWKKQDDICRRAEEGTGVWIFEEPNFKAWQTGRLKTLWCKGEPGAGKTTIASIIIDRLTKIFTGKNIGLAWIYVDYREHDLQSLESLFANLLAQFFMNRKEPSDSMSQFMRTNWKEAKPGLGQYKTWLKEELQEFDRTMIVVDALDEFRSTDLCQQFISGLQQLDSRLHLLVTSRPYVAVNSLSGNMSEIEICPRPEDVNSFVESRMTTNYKLRVHHMADPSILQLVKGHVSTAGNEMFLKAQLMLNALEYTEDTDKARSTIETFPTTYRGWYELSLKQIELQDSVRKSRAFRTLAWLSYLMLPLSVTAFEQALSIDFECQETVSTDTSFVSDIVLSCHGLVTIVWNETCEEVRLFHETAQDYLRNNSNTSLPPGDEDILRTCLAYLTKRDFLRTCHIQRQLDKRTADYPFFAYAARYWSDHVIRGDLESAYQGPILKFLESSQRHSADELYANDRRNAWGGNYSMPWTDWNRHSIDRRNSPLHAAATFGLTKTITSLLATGYKVDQRNNFGETPFHCAVQTGRLDAMEVLTVHGADLNATVYHHYLSDTTSLHLATACRQYEAVQFLLNHGVSVNLFDKRYGTTPLHLAASMDTDLTRLLLDHGANVNAPAKSPLFPETFPMLSLHFAVFFCSSTDDGAVDRIDMLLASGADVNAKSPLGNTALHMAILGGHAAIGELLLGRGADVHIANNDGKSSVQLARECGHYHWILGQIHLQTDSLDLSAPALCQAIWSQRLYRVEKILQTGVDIEQADESGNTAWDYCILSSNLDLALILVRYMQREDLPIRMWDDNLRRAINKMTCFDYTDRDTWETTVQICRLLYRKGESDTSFVTTRTSICDYNKTYLIHSAETGRVPEARFFLDCGSDVNAFDRFGSTGLHYAIGNKNVQMVELLISYGADVRIKDMHGHTALRTAEMMDNIPIRTAVEQAWQRASEQ